MSAVNPSETVAPKQITAAELREYLHLPAKDVAKELGMCLTSLKKVCRQHGILRWPYRRLKMIDRKIQSLEHHMAEGGEDQEDVRRQLEKLHNERAALPCNYGSGGADEVESDPSSPLSCASTTVTPQEMLAGGSASSPSSADEPDLDLDLPALAPPAAHVKPEPLAPAPAAPAPAPMTAAAALISSLPPQSPRAHAQRAGRPEGRGRPGGAESAGEGEAEGGGPGVEEDGSMRVELSLSPELASQVARGAQLVVHHSGGRATLQIIPLGAQAPAAGVAIPLPQAAVPGQEHAEAGEGEGSDEDMIAALVGCAAEKASQEGVAAGASLGGAEELSDEALALALAGCVREGDAMGGDAEEEPCDFGVVEPGEVAEWYEEAAGAHELDMTLFDHHHDA